jgi:8-oxo-dGTP pyrophosphatase MutT (NUDIX family)
MRFDLDRIRRALAGHCPPAAERQANDTEAAVALVLARIPQDRSSRGAENLALCVIHRAERLGDPWSGHLALPGGRADPSDPHPRAVAERETLEEVGLTLGDRHWLGALAPVLVRIGDSPRRRMIVHSFVYALDPAPAGGAVPAFALSDEVNEAFWVPLSYLWDPANASHVEWDRDGSRLAYPAIRFRGHAIWGLTFRILTLFSDVIDAPLPHLEELPGLGR